MANKAEVKKLPKAVLLVAAAVVLAGAIALGVTLGGSGKNEPEIVTVSTLEKIINISELSTFTAVYNGIAQVENKDKPEKIDYCVSYEAKVNAGIDFEQIQIGVDQESKAITVTLPPVHITKVNVDIATLDYIFLNDKMNQSAVSEAAYKACEQDAQRESEQEQAIFALAQQNAENMIRALIQPFIDQVDGEYGLNVEWEG